MAINVSKPLHCMHRTPVRMRGEGHFLPGVWKKTKTDNYCWWKKWDIAGVMGVGDGALSGRLKLHDRFGRSGQ